MVSENISNDSTGGACMAVSSTAISGCSLLSACALPLRPFFSCSLSRTYSVPRYCLPTHFELQTSTWWLVSRVLASAINRYLRALLLLSVFSHASSAVARLPSHRARIARSVVGRPRRCKYELWKTCSNAQTPFNQPPHSQLDANATDSNLELLEGEAYVDSSHLSFAHLWCHFGWSRVHSRTSVIWAGPFQLAWRKH